MMLDMKVVLHYWWLVLLIIVSAFFYKFALAAWLTRLFGASRGVSIKTGLALAQAGEFSFVLVNQISGLNMVEPWILQGHHGFHGAFDAGRSFYHFECRQDRHALFRQ